MNMVTTRTDGSTLEYVGVAEQATLIRKALAKAFPGTKFYVRSKSYSGGASIDVWYDGVDHDERIPHPGGWVGATVPKPKPGAPSQAAVEAIARAYAGGDFDGMIDLAYSIDRFLDADGNIVGGRSLGTEGSRGMHPAWNVEPIAPAARRVSFAGKYVFVNNELPWDVREKAAK